MKTIDLLFQGKPGVIASYLVADGGEHALIETGPASTLDTLVAELEGQGVDPAQIDKLIVTHIHLDHSGAAGPFMRRFPRARLYAHELGVPHLIDPSKLIASATRIYGDMMAQLWGEIVPVPAERVTALVGGDSLTVGKLRLDVHYTPGHASHHVAFHDAENERVFTGDVAAVRLQGFEYVRPPTPPPDLDLEDWERSIELILGLRPRELCLTHFGPFSDAARHLADARHNLRLWRDTIQAALDAGQDRPAIVDTIQRIGDEQLLRETNDARAVQRYELAAPYGMSVDGFLRYFRKTRSSPAGPESSATPAKTR